MNAPLETLNAISTALPKITNRHKHSRTRRNEMHFISTNRPLLTLIFEHISQNRGPFSTKKAAIERDASLEENCNKKYAKMKTPY
jgi:hypothetical protein